MSKRPSSPTSSPTGRSSTTLCDGCQKPFKRIQVHLNHNPACNSVYASRKSLIDPYGGIGGNNAIDSAAKAAQYHASLSSLIVTGGVNSGRESRSRHRFPAPFDFVAQNAGAATASVIEVDDANVFGEDEESVPPPPLQTPPDPFVNATTTLTKASLSCMRNCSTLSQILCPLLPNSHVRRRFILSCFSS